MKIEIKIEDFPDIISVKFNKKFKNKLFKRLKERISQRDFAKRISITENTISTWKLKEETFIQLKAIREIIDICRSNWREIEENIVGYKSRRDKKVIRCPKLPISDSKELREIIIHLMADGCTEGYNAYYNYDENAKREFIKELKTVFGDIDIKYHWDHVNLPMAVAYILSHHFKISFLSKKCRVPKEFFLTNKEYLISVIRAMIVDEGTIDGSNIRLDSCNQDFLEDIKKICNLLNIKCGKTWKSSGPIYRFNILAESIEKVHKEIGNIPIKNKEDLLSFAIKNQKREWKYYLPGETKKRIIEELFNGPLTSIELVSKTKMSRKIINKNTKILENKEIIKKIGKKRYTNLYYIKDKRLATMFLINPQEFLGGDKLDRYGKTQLNIIKALNKNKKLRYKDFLKICKIDKGALYKCLRGMEKKKVIKKKNYHYFLDDLGEKVLEFPKNLARYILYANVKNLTKIDSRMTENAYHYSPR